MITLGTKAGSNLLYLKATGKIQKENYKEFGPTVEELINEHGKIRILLELEDFHGWTASALWEDVKFDMKHFNAIEKLAIVGDKKWEKGMAAFCKPFTTAAVRYFEQSQLDEASKWVMA